jgi:acyl-CoA thioester hydrolase
MARIKIELPQDFIFSTEVPVLNSHINYGNHLDNGAVIDIVSEARMRFFKSLGFSEGDIEGAGIIVADAAVQYKSEAFQGEVLIVEYNASDFSRVGCDLVYRITEKATGREVARGKTGIVFFNYEKRETVPVPEKFKSQIATPLRGSQ